MGQIYKIDAFAIVALICCIYTVPTVGFNYIENMVLSYDNDTQIWQCDLMTCSKGMFGCNIQLHNTYSNSSKYIQHITTCYDSNFNIYASASRLTPTDGNETVSINIYSYLGCYTVASTGYSRSSQTINGTVSVQDWPMFQNITQQMVDDIENQPWYLE
ncbi:uncharacterized protein LOC119672879 [Teleopsis dalmanni]|uniref:uncharacterized protein LOC119672879 n=1 Tax=Teleopsis dalmanni TaxID=139649 RepID=UPI0018CFD2C7|nr:uncharacterized protein LOC119672879 [Teleopsis dalmanni]